MPKILRVVALLVILAVVAIVVMALNLNTLVKNGVETVGPMVLGVDVELQESDLSLFSGGGSLKGLKVHNPEGYKTEHLFNMKEVTLQVNPLSVTGDTIHIKKIIVDSPHVIYEGGLLNSNLKTLLDRLKGKEESSPTQPGTDEPKEETESPSKEKKLIIDHLLIKGVKMGVSSKLLQGKALTLPLPPIELKDIGKDKGGATPAEVVTQVVKKLYTAVEPAIKKAFGNLGAGLNKVKDQIKDGKLKDGLDKVKDKLKGENLKEGLNKGLKNLFGN